MDRESIIQKMLSLPTSYPANPGNDLILALTADTVRQCLSSIVKINGFERTHILHIRHWVMRKLEGVSHVSSDRVAADLRTVLLEGPGPTMEIIGDVIPLFGGYYIPTPWTAIETTSGPMLLISGFPASEVPGLDGHVRYGPVGRTVDGLNREELSKLGVRVLSIENYAGFRGRTGTPMSYLADIMSGPIAREGRPLDSWQPYSGDLNSDAGFKQRGHPRTAGSGPTYELWRAPLGDDYFDYFACSRLVGNARVVRVSHHEWRRVGLAIDAGSGFKRTWTLGRDGDSRVLDIEFPLPPSEYRLLYAGGFTWAGFHYGRPRYIVPSDRIPLVKELLSRCWIEVRT
jgi:hypothetical protein